MKAINILLLFTLTWAYVLGGEPVRGKQFNSLSPVSGGEIIDHAYYRLAYSEKYEQPFWVFYMLTPEFIEGDIERTNNFRADPMVKTGSATPNDYKESGYDKGHLCPAADMKLNETSVSESFFMSNMSPQVPSFNRGTWNNLEELVRKWAEDEDTLFIATGPVFRDDKGVIGEDRVTVPGYYYKVIYDPTGEKKMIAVLLRNSEQPQDLVKGVVSVDSIELLTGIDFFKGLPDELENRLEKRSDSKLWDFSTEKELQPAKASVKKNHEKQHAAVQCRGIAKSTGRRCKTMTTNANGYCTDHQDQAR